MQSDVEIGNTVRIKALDTIKQASLLLNSDTSISRAPDGAYMTSHDGAMVLREMQSIDGNNIICDIINDTCRRSELLGPKSSPLLIEFVQHLLHEMIKRLENNESITNIVDSVSKTIEKLVTHLPQYSKITNNEILFDMLNKLLEDDVSANIVIEAARLAGTECKIFVERSSSMKTVIERTDGCTFHLTPNMLFYRNDKWMFDDVKVFIIDGTIINVSEIDSILHQCHERNQPLAIFARGFAPDVISTLHVNWLRNTLKVIPIEINFDLESVNVINDIAVVSNSNVVSSLKGELISTTSYDNLAVVKRILCKGRVVVISCTDNKKIAAHVMNLREKRDNEPLNDVKNIIDERIKSLSAASVIIKIAGPTISATNILTQKVDLGLRMIGSILSYGIVDSESLTKIMTENDDKSVNAALSNLNDWMLPTLSVGCALHYGASLAQSIFSTGALITFKKD